MTTKNAETTNAPKSGNMPTMIAKQRIGRGRNASYERIGVAWHNDDGSVYVKVHGTQIVSGGFVLYPVNTGDDNADS